jgi:hypothetical protein
MVVGWRCLLLWRTIRRGMAGRTRGFLVRCCNFTTERLAPEHRLLVAISQL